VGFGNRIWYKLQWTVRRLKQQNKILRHKQIFAGVKAPIIDLKNIETIWICLGKLIQEQLIAIGIYMRELQKERFSRGRFDCPVEPKYFEQLLP
jgi:hypothetical protein